MFVSLSASRVASMGAVAALTLLAACSVTPPSQAPAAPVAAPGVREPQDLAEYQRLVAEHIHRASTSEVFQGRPPVPLKAVIVYSTEIDRDGRIVRTRLLRSKGIPELDARAAASIQRAQPLPRPPAHLMRGRRSIEISESWLFDDAGRFQLRSLSPGQQLRAEDGRLI